MLFTIPDITGALEGIMLIMIVVLIVTYVIFFLIAIWVYKDAKKRDMNAVVWLLIVLLTGCIDVLFT